MLWRGRILMVVSYSIIRYFKRTFSREIEIVHSCYYVSSETSLSEKKVSENWSIGHDIPLRIISLNVPWNLHLSRNAFFSNISWRRCRSQNLINLLFCTELSREFPMPFLQVQAHRIFIIKHFQHQNIAILRLPCNSLSWKTPNLLIGSRGWEESAPTVHKSAPLENKQTMQIFFLPKLDEFNSEWAVDIEDWVDESQWEDLLLN